MDFGLRRNDGSDRRRHFEAARSLPFDHLHLDPVDLGRPRAGAALGYERFHRGLLAIGRQLDAPVASVADPAPNSERERLVLGPLRKNTPWTRPWTRTFRPITSSPL